MSRGNVLIVGGTGSVGQRTVPIAIREGWMVRVLTRKLSHARRLPGGVQIIQGDLEDTASLMPAVAGIDAVIFCHGTGITGSALRRIDYGGVLNVLRALGDERPHLTLMTSIHVTQLNNEYREFLTWKRRAERLIRASGAPYTIVRPSWFDRTRRGENRVVLKQGDLADGGVTRDQIAEILVRSLSELDARNKTFELFSEPGPAPNDWSALFAALAGDQTGAVDGAKDPINHPVTAEPSDIITELKSIERR